MRTNRFLALTLLLVWTSLSKDAKGAGNGIAQSTKFDAGKYTVGLAVVKRSGHERTASPLSIALDGVHVFTLEASHFIEIWGRFTSPVFTVTAGPHTLAFILGEGGMVLIDEVVLRSSKRRGDSARKGMALR